ncbi:MAG: ATP-binding protein [Alphaproteobacteria bacterium]|nr:ATP-binding protein [Alphaproteobacteria bacterium]
MINLRKKYTKIKEHIRQNDNVEAPKRFIERVMIVSLPTALTLLILALCNEIEPIIAIVAFGTIVVLTIVLALPFFTKLEDLTKYIHSLSEDGEEQTSAIDTDETTRIIHSINRMRSVWLNKTEELTAQTLSDAAVLDSLPDPLLMIDDQMILTGANLSARQIFGQSIRGKELSSVVEKTDLAEKAKMVLDGQFRKQKTEAVLNDKIYSVKIERLPAQANGGAVALISFYDITARKIFEQMQTDFVANASHELRTPLSILSGFIETMDATPDMKPEDQKKFFGIMKQQSERMSILIENLLSLSKLEINREKPAEEVNIPEILKKVKTALEAKADKFGDKIVIKSAIQSLKIVGFESQLFQVFQNLTDNALKYGQQRGKITLTAKEQDNQFIVEVHNTGDIIPKAALPHLFERFYRVAEMKSKANGTGLGLAIVAEIVKHHKGEISVESSAEAGTTFKVVLPGQE